MTKLTIEEIAEIESLIANNLVTQRKHPELDLYLLNYTSKMQYTNAWTDIGEQCRGLIVDRDYNVIKRPFRKFFNLGERLQFSDLPAELPLITTKYDGFLGIGYTEGDKPAITTRGHFRSPMSVWATKWIRDKGYTVSDFKDGYTYLFEIVDPVLCRSENLLVNHGNLSGCILLAVIETSTGSELDHIIEAKRLDLQFAEEYVGSLDDAIAEMPIMKGTEQEGYVCRYSGGLRIKLKCDEYKRLHRVLSGLSPKRILSTMIESGKDGIESMVADIPDEAYAQVREIVDKIENEQRHLIERGRVVYDIAKELSTRREQATFIQQSSCSAVAFAMLNGKDYQNVALKQVKKTIQDWS